MYTEYEFPAASKRTTETMNANHFPDLDKEHVAPGRGGGKHCSRWRLRVKGGKFYMAIIKKQKNKNFFSTALNIGVRRPARGGRYLQLLCPKTFYQ